MASIQETPWYRNALPKPAGPTLGAGHIQVKFVNSIGKPSAKRKRTRAACLNCRKSKTKCDGAQPSCKACAKQRRQCLGYPEKSQGPPWRNREKSQRGSPAQEEVASSSSNSSHCSSERQQQQHQWEPANNASSSSSTAGPSVYIPQGSASSPSTLSPTSTSSRLTPPQMYSIPTQHTLDAPARSCPGSAYSRTESGCTAPCCQPFQWMCGTSDRRAQGVPQYSTNQAEPVHPLVLSLGETLFKHAACHFGFLEEARFLQSVRDRTADTILVNAVCAVASSLPDPDSHQPHHNGSGPAPHGSEVRGYASTFVARVKEAAGMVDTPCSSSLGTVQALVVIAYGAFGADQMTSARVYLEQAMGIAAGLQSVASDGWDHSLVSLCDDSGVQDKHQLVETLRAMFILDRAMASILSQPTKAHRDLLNLDHIQSLAAHADNSPSSPIADQALVGVFLQVLDYNSMACDLFNKLRHSDVNGSTQQVWDQISLLERRLTALYESWDTARHMPFNTSNLQHYIARGQGTTFVLVHLWLHALFITLHQHRSSGSGGGESRKLRMTSANTIYDILTFVDLIDSKCLVSSPLSSHPVYVAAGAFMHEASTTALETYSQQMQQAPTSSPDMGLSVHQHQQRRHSMLVSAATHRYETCHASLQRLGAYWVGTMNMLRSLNGRSQEENSYGRGRNEAVEQNASLVAHQQHQASPVLMSQRDVLPMSWKDSCSSNSSSMGTPQPQAEFFGQRSSTSWPGETPCKPAPQHGFEHPRINSPDGFLPAPMGVEGGNMMGGHGYLDSMVHIMDAPAWDGSDLEVDQMRPVPDFGWAPWGAKPLDMIL